jgi:hypothetical protein
MAGREAKFCLDRNQVRWVLLEGVINRKTPQDDPDKGMNLPVSKIQRIEETVIERQHKNALAAPASFAGLLVLALSGWIASSSLWLGLPGLILGALVLIWGLRRISGSREKLGSYQIIAAETTPQDWLIVGSHHEVVGFIEGLRAELERARRQQAAARN